MTHSESSPDLQPDTADYREVDWRRFQAVERLTNHWNRPGWLAGRRSYHWLISLEDSPELRALAARCQAKLQDFPTLDLVPLTSLHLTLQRAGFTDEMRHAQARAIFDAAREGCAAIAPLTLKIGPLAGSPGAVRFSVGPRQPMRQVFDAVRAAIADVRGKQALSDGNEPFIPHVSIAYSNADTPARPVIERVAALRELGAVTARVDGVRLVELRREGRSYVWETVGNAGLGTNK